MYIHMYQKPLRLLLYLDDFLYSYVIVPELPCVKMVELEQITRELTTSYMNPVFISV